MKLVRRMRLTGFFLLAAVSMTCAAAEQREGADQFGIFSRSQGEKENGCAAIAGAAVAVGQSVTIVLSGRPQQILTGLVRSGPNARCPGLEKALLKPPFYEVELTGGKSDVPGTGILVNRPASSFRVDKDAVVADAGRGKAYRFHECASQEGVHFMVLSAAPSRPDVLWHEYFYLGYDVEPSCSGKEYAAIDALDQSLNGAALKGAR